MRPVARIAQSVEQGIENPRVLGSIPSPGTTSFKPSPLAGVFAFGVPDSSSNDVRLFATSLWLTPAGPARFALCKNAPGVFVRVRAPLIQKTQPVAGFLLLGFRTLHRTMFDCSPPPCGSPLRGQRGSRCAKTLPAFLSESGHHLFREPSLWLGFCFGGSGLFIERCSIVRHLPVAHPCGASAVRAVQKRSRRFCPSPGTTYSENPAYGWVFAFGVPDSSSNDVRLFATSLWLTPAGPARFALCKNAPGVFVRVRAPLIQRTQPMAGFLLLGVIRYRALQFRCAHSCIQLELCLWRFPIL